MLLMLGEGRGTSPLLLRPEVQVGQLQAVALHSFGLDKAVVLC